MESLPFADGEFDTIIVDDVLGGATDPAQVLSEASRLLRDGGRMLLLASVDGADVAAVKHDFTEWAACTGLRLAPPRSIPDKNPIWLLAVATVADDATAAA